MENFSTFKEAYENCKQASELTEKLEKSFDEENPCISDHLMTKVYFCRAAVLVKMLEVQSILAESFASVCPRNIAEAQAQKGFVCGEFFAFLVATPNLIWRAKEKILKLVQDMIEYPTEGFIIDENVAQVMGEVTCSEIKENFTLWSKSEEPFW